MVSYAAGTRYLSLIGGVPELLRLVLRLAAGQPASLGRADRRAGIGRLVQLHLPDGVGLERAADAHADAHFYTEVRYKGTKTVAVSPDFGEMAKFGDIWLAPKQGTDAALAWPWAT
jgi:nitrate reductase alpha subunit